MRENKGKFVYGEIYRGWVIDLPRNVLYIGYNVSEASVDHLFVTRNPRDWSDILAYSIESGRKRAEDGSFNLGPPVFLTKAEEEYVDKLLQKRKL